MDKELTVAERKGAGKILIKFFALLQGDLLWHHTLKFHPCRGQCIQRRPNFPRITVKISPSVFAACSASKPLLTHPWVLTPCYSPVCLQISWLWNNICFHIALLGSGLNHAPHLVSVIAPRGICHTAPDHRAVCCMLWLAWIYANDRGHTEAFDDQYYAQHNLLNIST